MILADPALNLASPHPPRGWDDFVRDCPEGTIYHDTAWLHVLATVYSFRPYFLTLTDASGEIAALLPLFLVDSRLTGRRLVSLPYTNTAGPLHRAGVDPTPLLEAAIALARQEACRYVEIRGQASQERPTPSSFARSDYFGSFLLNLEPGLEAARDGFDKRVRRGIAKAEKLGVDVRFGTDRGDVEEFYRLNLFTRHKHGVPPQPFRFFDTLWSSLRPRGQIEVVLAQAEGCTVAGLILLAYKDTVIYAYGASDPRYLRLAPNHALFARAIEWSIEQGYRSFDFGRTSPDNEGLMAFKRQWGAAWKTLPYEYWPERDGFVSESESGWKYRCMTALWRRLPLAATRLLGPALYRNLA